MSDINKRIKTAMERRNYSISELARRSGLNKGTVSKYVNSQLEPKQNAIAALAQALNVSPAWLLGLDPEPDDIESLVLLEVQKLSKDGKVRVIDFVKFLLYEEGIEENGDPEV